jgi:hypothetical protein
MFEGNNSEHGASKDDKPKAVEQHVHHVTVHQAIGEKGCESLSGIKAFCLTPKTGPKSEEEGGNVTPMLPEKVACAQRQFKQGERGDDEPERFRDRI